MSKQSTTIFSTVVHIRWLTCYLLVLFISAINAQDTEDILSEVAVLQENRQHKAALNLLESLIEKQKKQNLPKDTLLANIYHKIGVSYFNINELDQTQAIEYWEKALAIRKSVLPETAIPIVKGYYNIGSAYYQMNEFEKAVSYLIKSQDLHLLNPAKDTALLCKTYRDFGSVQIAKRNFSSAESYLLTASDLAASFYLPKKKLSAQGNYYTALFEFYYEQGDEATAVEYLQRGLGLYEEIPPKEKDDSIQIANHHNNLGLIYQEQGELDLAISEYLMANQINRNYEDRTSNLAINYYNLAELYQNDGKLPLALQNIDLAINLDLELNNRLDLAWDYSLKAQILEDQQNISAALEWQQAAIQELTYDFHSKSVMELPATDAKMIDAAFGIQLLDAKAQLIQKYANVTGKQDYLEQAEATYQYISIVLDQIRLGFQSDDAKSFLASESKDILERAIYLNFDLYENQKHQKYIEQAYQYLAQSKAVILWDALNDAGAKEFAGIPNTLLEEEQKLSNQLLDIEQRLFETTEDKQKLYDERIKAERALYQLKAQLEQDYPEYIQLKYDNQIPSLSDIQARLDRTMIEYFVGKENIYVFIIDPEQVDWIQIPLDFDLRTQIKQLRIGLYGKYLNTSQKNINYDSLFVYNAHSLYEAIMAPVYTKRKVSEQLIIIPDGILGYIPFEVLLTDLPSKLSLPSSYAYLLKRHQISYCYSAALLQEMQMKQHSQKLRNFAAFAPIFNNTTNPNLVNVTRGELLPPMKYNIPEAQVITKLLKGKLFEKMNAIESKFVKYAPNYKIIHLATHGTSNDEVGDYAFLAFTAIEDSIENEFLYNRELYNLQLNADMVVLSACETGIGELQEGEGIISLARGFSYAGAKSIITTLWSVNDASTKELMEIFYTYIKNGKTKDAALRQAKLDFIDRYGSEAYPFYWAGFVGVGDMSALDLDSQFQWWWFLLFSPLFLFYFWYRRK